MPGETNHMQRIGCNTTAQDPDSGSTDNELMTEPALPGDSSLYQELGKLTREIHDSISVFAHDKRISELAQDEIPDARDRLKFIVTKTGEAAHRTMTGAEATASIAGTFIDQAQIMRKRWQQFSDRELSKQGFCELVQNLDRFLATIETDSQTINGNMTEIMLAQDYQDITGQLIKQVTTMVQEIEEKLVRLITITGVGTQSTKPGETQSAETPVGPQLPGECNKNVVHSQNDVDDLLASLGF